MRGSRSIAALALAAAAALAVAGCNMAVPALYVIEGPGKRPAVFTLPEDSKVVVYVDDRRNVVSRLQLRAALADDIGTRLRDLELVKEVVSGRELIGYVRRVETPSKRVSIEEMGQAVGADLVVYVEMDGFALSPDGATPKPVGSAFVKVVDVKARERLFPPPGGDPMGWPVSAEVQNMTPEMFRTSAQRRRAEDLLEKKLAEEVARLFHDHEPKNFGGGVTEFRG
jgi:hypothetical protein